MENKIQELTNIIKNSQNIVFFGGAGVSTDAHNKFRYKIFK